MSTRKTILLIGLAADQVDYRKWPDLSAEKLEQAFADIKKELTGAGYDAHWCLTDTGATAEAKVSEMLNKLQPDMVLIGAGVRTDPDHFLLFEKMINAVHRQAPDAPIAFNTNPFDTIDAVKRWL